MTMPRKAALMVLALSIVSFCHADRCCALDAPKPDGRVNDFANVIPEDYRAKLDALIRETDEKTSAEIAVVTVDSIAPLDENAYARMLFDTWKIGKKGKDNGVLILLAVKERRWRVETGYGLEGILPDGRCGELGRSYMVPLFKAGNYAEGLYRGTAAVAGIIAKDANVTIDSLAGIKPVSQTGSSPEDNNPFLYAVLFFLTITWNMSWPIFIGLPVTLFFAFVLSGISPFVAPVIIIGYVLSLILRLHYWRRIPKHKRPAFYGPQTFGGWTSTGSGGWSSGGGGFGGGGFGGGGGGGGGAGGGF